MICSHLSRRSGGPANSSTSRSPEEGEGGPGGKLARAHATARHRALCSAAVCYEAPSVCQHKLAWCTDLGCASPSKCQAASLRPLHHHCSPSLTCHKLALWVRHVLHTHRVEGLHPQSVRWWVGRQNSARQPSIHVHGCRSSQMAGSSHRTTYPACPPTHLVHKGSCRAAAWPGCIEHYLGVTAACHSIPA